MPIMASLGGGSSRGFGQRGVLLPTAIGEAAYGGFYAGIIDTTQPGAIDAADNYQTPLRYLLIVAPLSLESSAQTWRTSTASVSGASTRWNGLAAQNALASSTYPAFNYCNNLSFPNDGGSKWYLPALDELELLYRNFKPDAGNNVVGSTGSTFPSSWSYGVNRSSNPQGTAYTSTVPGRTPLTAWQTGGAQAFSIADYWSATWASSANAWRIYWAYGGPAAATQTVNSRVRPVRRVVL